MTTLSLFENNLTSLKKSLQHLIALTDISLSQNRITSIVKDNFMANVMLTSIQLNDNAITAIEDGSFDTILDLQYLDIYNNNLSSAGTYKAGRIKLNNNQLKSIYIGEKTGTIQMSNNYIEMINCTEKEMSVTKLLVNVALKLSSFE